MTDATDSAAAFDALAEAYDETFSEGVLGRTLRERVWRRLDSAFRSGDRVLDIGCGTGEDALHMAERGIFVVATDASTEMVEHTRRKVESAGLTHRVDLRRVAAEAVGRELGEQRFHGVLSNFGVLNCVEDLDALARDLAPRVMPHGRAFLCLMGPVVPWEWAWYLLEGDVRKAFRRLVPGGAEWRGMRIRYPTVGDVCKAFEPEFRARSACALGALLPPSYAEGWAKRHPELVGRLAELEERLEAIPPLAWFSDHYLVELVRR